MRSAYSDGDVTILLNEISPARSDPGPPEFAYALYAEAMHRYSARVAGAVGLLAERILRRRGEDVALVSIVPHSIPCGILIRRYLRRFHGLCARHYAVSCLHGQLDDAAMREVLSRHDAASVQFILAWAGSGKVLSALQKEAERFPGLSGKAAALSDPAGLCLLHGTREDFLLPTAALGPAGWGLLSLPEPPHRAGYCQAAYLENLASRDRSLEFLRAVSAQMYKASPLGESELFPGGGEEIRRLHAALHAGPGQLACGVSDTTRMLTSGGLRGVYLGKNSHSDTIGHLISLCRQMGVPCGQLPFGHFNACGVLL